MTTTHQAFEAFAEAIAITDYQRASIVEGRTAGVNEDLRTAFPEGSDLPFMYAKLMGSASKGTIVRPVDDVDVLAVFSNTKNAWQDRYWNDSRAFLYRIRRAYDGYSVAQVGARGQAVRVFYQTGGHVDIAPVFMKSDGVFHLPAGDGSWLLTAPFAANAWFLDKNKQLGYNLAPLVRLLKKWNQAHSKRLRSFHLETIAGSTFASLSSNQRTNLRDFFNWAGGHLYVFDPGGQSGLLNSYLSWSDEQEIKKSFDVAYGRALKAIEAESRGDHSESNRLWRVIFGDDFPT